MSVSDDSSRQEREWATPPPGPTVVERSFDASGTRDRAAKFLRDRMTRPGMLARRLMGQRQSRDAELVDQLIRERRRRTRIDGSTEGALLPTAWTVWELRDLECPADHAAVVRTVGYVLAQQDRPGRFGEACSAERHEQRLCRHFLDGFFSPGPRDELVGPLEFRSGLVITDEEEARFAVSCFALRAVLRAEADRRSAVRRHVESLLAMRELWDPLGSKWSADLGFLALGALALAPLEYRNKVDEIATLVANQQLPDGRWEGAELFNALDMLMSTSTTSTREAIKRTVPLLCGMQLESGAFDPTGNEEMTLIALRALRMAEKR